MTSTQHIFSPKWPLKPCCMPENQQRQACIDGLVNSVLLYITSYPHSWDYNTVLQNFDPVYCSRSSFKVHVDKWYLPVTCHELNSLLIVCFVGLLICVLVVYKSNMRNIMPRWHHCVDEAIKYQLLKNSDLFTSCKILSILDTLEYWWAPKLYLMLQINII